ncbi:MAG TPA: hypothetical protein VL400_09770 [Polyangiaceae bacterium]|jgi:hypothetical protein|nr:hypothetical protein [Polyangiaceae bacterium]
MTCNGCGATLDVRAETCPYCNAATPLGAQLAAQREAARRFREQQQWAFDQMGRATAQADVQKSGTRALMWALAGLVPCFLWIPSFVAIVFVLRTHSEAKKASMSLPGTAIGALAISIGWLGLLVLAIVMGQVDASKRQARIDALDKDLAGELDGDSVDLDAACALAEKRLLEGVYPDHKSVNKVDCALAKVVATDDGLELENARVSFGTDAPETLRFCMKKGSRWTIDAVRPMSTPCNAPMPVASASAAVEAAGAKGTGAPVAAPTARPASSSERR